MCYYSSSVASPLFVEVRGPEPGQLTSPPVYKLPLSLSSASNLSLSKVFTLPLGVEREKGRGMCRKAKEGEDLRGEEEMRLVADGGDEKNERRG